MSTNDKIALALIAVIVITVIIFFVVRRLRKTNRIKSLLKNHSGKIKVLLDWDRAPSISELSEDDIATILSLSKNDWDEWGYLIQRVHELGNNYPDTVYEFINDFIPKARKRKSFNKDIRQSTNIQRIVSVAIDSMLLEELRLIDADSEDTWKQKDKLRERASQIREKYADGYKTYCDIQNDKNPKHGEIISDRKRIIELQSIYENCKNYEGWEEKQKDFCSTYWKILKDVRPQDGRYYYFVPFNKPTRKGALVESKFMVWQGFCECCSSFLLDRQTDSFKENYLRLEALKNRNRYFYDHVYDEIFQIIQKYAENIDGDLCIILIDRCKRDWPVITYDYHYRRVKELIAECDFYSYNFSELPNITDDGNMGGIFILDFVTSNEELLNNCKLIIEHFKKSVPLIGYYSMNKEYDEEELIELAEENEGYLNNDEGDEETDIGFIKNCLLQVNKHQFFTYVAIPNTWIGEATRSEETKRTWLDNPNQYYFRTKEKEDYISGEYSIDGGNSYQELSIIGSKRDVDDVARYTYLLFKEMDVLDEFKEKGQKAIEFMNSVGCLAHHKDLYLNKTAILCAFAVCSFQSRLLFYRRLQSLVRLVANALCC